MSKTNTAIQDIANERERQVTKEGWSHKHDDDHEGGQLADAAACYAANDLIYTKFEAPEYFRFEDLWPFEGSTKHKKRKGRRKQLVIAGALIVAEIERLDRLAQREGGGDE